MRKKIHIEKIAEAFSSSISSQKDYATILLNLTHKILPLCENKNDMQSIIQHVICTFIQNYYDNKAKIYRMGEVFYNDLVKVNLNIDVSYIKYEYEKTFCIEFPIPYIIGDIYFTTVFILYARTKFGEPSIVMVFGSEDRDGKLTDTYKLLCMRCDKDKVDDLVKEIPGFDENEVPIELIKNTLKCILYINSGEPDLENESYKFESKKVQKFKKKLKQFSPFSIVNVGYNYKKKKFYKDATVVRTHLRWQPYGTDKSLVKLIWIKEHERKFGVNCV